MRNDVTTISSNKITEEDTTRVYDGFEHVGEISRTCRAASAFIFVTELFIPHSRRSLQFANCVATTRRACRKPFAADATSYDD